MRHPPWFAHSGRVADGGTAPSLVWNPFGSAIEMLSDKASRELLQALMKPCLFVHIVDLILRHLAEATGRTMESYSKAIGISSVSRLALASKFVIQHFGTVVVATAQLYHIGSWQGDHAASG